LRCAGFYVIGMRRDHKPTPFAVLSLQSEAIRFQMRKYRLRQQSHTFAECANELIG